MNQINGFESGGLPRSKWYYNPWFVLFMLLFVLGPFALPLLYKSPRFSRKWKIAWTILTAAMFYLMVVGTIKTYEVLQPMIRALLESVAASA